MKQTHNDETVQAELIERNAYLEKENEKILKRLERVVNQGDRQHKQLEKLNEKLETYIEVIDDYVISLTLDRDKNITTISTAFANAFGFKPKELIGLNYGVLFEKEDLEKLDVELIDAVEAKQPWHGEIRIRNKIEIPVWTSTIVTPKYDEGELHSFTIISEDISKDKELERIRADELSKKQYDQNMLEFMSSRSSAVLQRVSKSFSYIVWIILATVSWAIIWASFATLEELTRGSGKIVPSQHVRKVESFDIGRVEAIYAREGESVRKGQVLLKLNDIENNASYSQNDIRLAELKAKAKRLHSEADAAGWLNDELSGAMQSEWKLYRDNREQLDSKLSALSEKISQKKSELDEAVKKEVQLSHNYKLLENELFIKKQMAEEKIISEVEYLQLVRQKNDMLQNLNQVRNEIIRANSSIKELGEGRRESELAFRSRSRQEYLDVTAEIAKLSQDRSSLHDRLQRTEVISPIEGVVKKVYVNTMGEVVQPGNMLFEIVPKGEKMICETKINPENIAYVKLGQNAMLKFSAFDFSKYGGIPAKVSYISPDTIQDPDDKKYYYTVRLTMSKDYVGSKEHPLYVQVGMVADADIIHGKKTVMDYILKPILKAKQTALSEK